MCVIHSVKLKFSLPTPREFAIYTVIHTYEREYLRYTMIIHNGEMLSITIGFTFHFRLPKHEALVTPYSLANTMKVCFYYFYP